VARVEILTGKRVPLVSRVLARMARRKWGRVTEMMQVAGSVPRVAAGWAAFEMLFDRSALVERGLRKLVATRAAMLIGSCP
jgi:hypothetical protein